jgi:hypothetical protein
VVIPAAGLVFIAAYVVGAVSPRLAAILCAVIISVFVVWLVLGVVGLI